VRLADDSVVCAFYRDADTPDRVFCNWEGSDDEGVTLKVRGRARIVPSTGKRPILFATPPKDCGDTVKVGAGAYDVRARRVSCRTARRLARTYYETRETGRWSCEERRLDLEDWKVRCTRGDAVVRFGYGA